MISTLVLYGISSLAVTIVPGPTMLLALTNGITNNRPTIIMGMLGAACSDIIFISLVAYGIGAILSTSIIYFELVKIFGIIYLSWLSFKLWFSGSLVLNDSITEDVVLTSDKLHMAFFKSLFAALANPKGMIFFSAFVPQFIDLQSPKYPQYVYFCMITVALDLIVMGCYAFAGVHISRVVTSVKLKMMNRFCALIMFFMALGLYCYKSNI